MSIRTVRRAAAAAAAAETETPLSPQGQATEMGGRGCDWVGWFGSLQMQGKVREEERDSAGDLTDRPPSQARHRT